MRSVLVIWLENGQPVYYSNRDMWAHGGGACHERPSMLAVYTKTPRFQTFSCPHRKFVFTSLPWLHCDTRWCASAQRMCVYYMSRLRPHHIRHPLYYCTFMWGISNICERGGTAKGHRVMEVSNTLLHKSTFEREITRRLTGKRHIQNY